MTTSLAPDFTPEIQVVHDRIMTTSLAVSNVFEKNHRDVLRSIKDLEIPEDYRERNFAPTFRDVPGPNGSLRKEPMYLITRDGFTILAMGFTGKRAMEFKIKYIEAFNRMEEELRRRKENPRIIEDAEALLRRRREQDRIRQARHRAKIAELPPALPDIDLNFPKESARPSRPFWKDLPEDLGSLSIQDLLDPDYPDPLRKAIDRIEAAGFDANGLRVQYEAMKGHLRSCAAAFTEIYHLARVRRIE